MENIQPLRKYLLLFSLFALSTFCFSQVTEQWLRRYNGPFNGIDAANDLAVDAQGNVYVTGYSEGNGTIYDYNTIKYDAAGNELWVKRYNGPANGEDRANSLAVDASGNVYVTGYSTGNGTSSDYATIKYDTDGNELWIKRYNGPKNDVACFLAVDAAGNVYVTGQSNPCIDFCRSPSLDYLTIKYYTNGNT
jgi:hypothetical protein